MTLFQSQNRCCMCYGHERSHTRPKVNRWQTSTFRIRDTYCSHFMIVNVICSSFYAAYDPERLRNREIDFSSKNVERANKTRASAKFRKPQEKSFSSYRIFPDLSLCMPQAIGLIFILYEFHQNLTSEKKVMAENVK